MSVSPLVLALLVATAPQGPAKKTTAKASTSAKSALASNVVAQYNGVNITVAEIKAILVATNARKVVPEIIQKLVIEQQAKKAGVSVTSAELKEKVQEEKAKVVAQMMQSTGAPMTFAEITKKYGLTEAEVAQTVRLNLLARKAFGKSLEKDVKGLDGQVRLSHILLATIPLTPTPDQKPLTADEQKKKDDEVKSKMDQLLADIKSGKTKFEDAAKQFSDDKQSGAQGGELPWAPKGTFVPEFETAAFALQKPGDLSVPVKSQFGWHVIKLLQKGADAPAAEKAQYKKKQIDERLNQPNAVQQWLASLAGNAKVIFNPNVKLF